MTTALRLQRDQAMLDCIDNCTNCASICAETAQYCLEQGGRHAAPDHIRLLLDCQQICRTSADFMVRASDLHGEICRACAVVCARCAEDCSGFGDDAQMNACADMCRKCAESCEAMASNV